MAYKRKITDEERAAKRDERYNKKLHRLIYLRAVGSKGGECKDGLEKRKVSPAQAEVRTDFCQRLGYDGYYPPRCVKGQRMKGRCVTIPAHAYNFEFSTGNYGKEKRFYEKEGKALPGPVVVLTSAKRKSKQRPTHIRFPDTDE